MNKITHSRPRTHSDHKQRIDNTAVGLAYLASYKQGLPRQDHRSASTDIRPGLSARVGAYGLTQNKYLKGAWILKSRASSVCQTCSQDPPQEHWSGIRNGIPMPSSFWQRAHAATQILPETSTSHLLYEGEGETTLVELLSGQQKDVHEVEGSLPEWPVTPRWS